MDFVILGAALLFALIGIIKGGAKLFFGLFMLIVIMIGCAFLSSLISPLFLVSEKDGNVTYTSAAKVFMDPIGKKLPSGGDFGTLLDTTIVKAEDGTLYVGETTLNKAVSDNVPYVGTFVAPFVAKAATPNHTLRESISFTASKYIYEAIIWLVLVIILVIIRNIVRKKIYRFLDKSPVPSKVDRVIGLVMNLALLVAIFWVAGVVIAKFDDGTNWAHSADTFLLKGVIANPFFKNNPLLKLIHVTLPISASA